MDIIHLDMFKFEFYIKGAIVELKRTNEEERQVTKPTSPLQSCRSRTDFWQFWFPLHSCCSRYNVSRIFLKGLFFATESDSYGA